MVMNCEGIYEIFSAIVPMYFAVLLGYGSVTWWGLITPAQCLGIGKFITYVALPMLVFKVTSDADFYAMDPRFAGADTLQKVALLVGLFAWLFLSRSGKLEWVITVFSIATLPNNLVIGIPLLEAMYPGHSAPLMVQVVVLQGVVWNNVVLLLHEYRAAGAALLETQLPSDRSPVIANINQNTFASAVDNAIDASPASKVQDEVVAPSRGPKPPVHAMAKRVWRKFVQNPNTFASVLGLAWSLISVKVKLKMPIMLRGCVSIISNMVLGLVMYNIGLFIGLQPKIISCGKASLALSMAAKFLLGPILMIVTSLALGLRGTLLNIAILQAALPLANVPFVFAQEYDVYPNLISTSVIFGLIIATPILLVYQIVLEKL